MRIRHVCSERPDVPEDWVICNAPRPIVGTKTWTGPFIEGVFYAAIDPVDEQKDWMIMRNSSQSAVQIFYHTESALVSLAIIYYKKNYPDTVNEIDEVEMRDWLVSRGLEILNEGSR